MRSSGLYEYEELPSNSINFESSTQVEGTHQSWRSSRASVNDGDIVPAEHASNRSRDTGYGSPAGSSRDLLNGGPQVIVSRDATPQGV